MGRCQFAIHTVDVAAMSMLCCTFTKIISSICAEVAVTNPSLCDTRLHEALAKQACWHLLHTWLPPSTSVSQSQGNCVMLPLKMTATAARFQTGQLHIVACSASIYS